MTANTPNESQRRFSSHKNTPRPPSLSPKQRAARDREEVAREVEQLREHQRVLRAQAYRRLFGRTPPEESPS